jgi:alpha-amylase
MGPPSDPDGNTNAVTCAASLETASPGQWVCEHRDPVIGAMVRFRRVVAGTTVVDWWDNGANAIAFSRGDRGFVALNLDDTTVVVDAGTPLAPDTYCDLLTGGATGGTCVGRSIVVGADGRIQVDVEPGRAVAIHVGTRMGDAGQPPSRPTAQPLR